MTLRHLLYREMVHRKTNFLLSVIAVVAAVASLTGAHVSLNAYDSETHGILTRMESDMDRIMADLNEEMRKATLKLSFNLTILPKDQDPREWYTDDYGSKTMPEDYVTRLAESGIVTVQHFLPTLQQRIVWPEKQRTIILVGTRGEILNPSKESRQPLVDPVPEGRIVLGCELARSLGYSPGDKVTLSGKEYIVHQVHGERGNKDDITAWIPLSDAQKMLHKEGRINAILALGCMCAGPARILLIRTDIAKTLPDTQVIEIGSSALARFEARSDSAKRAEAAIEQVKLERGEKRKERARLAGVLVPLISAASALCVGLLAYTNVLDRWPEIGILRALGLRSRRIKVLFLSKSLIIGFAGGLLGIWVGLSSGRWLGIASTEAASGATDSWDPGFLLAAFLVAPILSIIAGWIPAALAAGRDPASVLRDG